MSPTRPDAFDRTTLAPTLTTLPEAAAEFERYVAPEWSISHTFGMSSPLLEQDLALAAAAPPLSHGAKASVPFVAVSLRAQLPMVHPVDDGIKELALWFTCCQRSSRSISETGPMF